MKNLANCAPSEFLSQTNKIRKSAERWLKATDIMNIRKNVPKFDPLPDDIDGVELTKILNERKEIIRKTGVKNFSKMLDAIADKHPKETLELLALVNFVEPEDVDEHPMSEYLVNTTSMLTDDAVLGFFTSLMSLGQMNILGA